jgi:hypothetical protein
MNAVSALQSYLIPAKFEKALKSIRAALAGTEVEIVQEFELPEDLNQVTRMRSSAARLLLVSSPVLDFEAVALGRAGAVFFPLHILIAPEEGCTRVCVVNPAELLEGRMPVGLGDPLEKLVARLGIAFDSLVGSPERLN